MNGRRGPSAGVLADNHHAWANNAPPLHCRFALG